MNLRKAATVVALAAGLSLPLTACSKQEASTNNNVIECDAGDQREHDLDCGYYQGDQWVWYNWVVMGQTSYSPAGFQPVAVDEDDESGHSTKKSRKSKSITVKPVTPAQVAKPAASVKVAPAARPATRRR